VTASSAPAALLALAAVVVYERVGLRLPRAAWIDIDLLWAVGLIAAALTVPLRG
jgi:hypothetical protein